jgi:uncharacterized protein YqgC (DUF456 family)
MPFWLDVSIYGLTIFVMLIGLVGTVVPLFPGVFVIWLAALGYGIVMGFTTLGIVMFVLITLLMATGTLIDNVLMGVGARKGGAAWSSLIIALVAGVAGTLLWPPIGGLIAAPGSVYLAEYVRHRDWKKALSATGGLAAGWGLSFLARFGIGVMMIILWLVWAWVK